MSNKSINLAGLWEAQTKKGQTFFASNKISFGDLRNLLKEFKEENDVTNTDNIVFYLFQVESDNDRAPVFHLNFKKDDYKGNK